MFLLMCSMMCDGGINSTEFSQTQFVCVCLCVHDNAFTGPSSTLVRYVHIYQPLYFGKLKLKNAEEFFFFVMEQIPEYC